MHTRQECIDVRPRSNPADQVRPEEGHRHGAANEQGGQPEIRLAAAPVHSSAAGLVDCRGGQVGRDNGGNIANSEEDQGRRHERAAAHAGDANHDTNSNRAAMAVVISL